MAKLSRPRTSKVVGAGVLAGGLLLAAPAGMALAAPGGSNGVPGQINGSPGSYFKEAAKSQDGSGGPTLFGGNAPGQMVKQVAGSLGDGAGGNPGPTPGG